jgi:hypothetical protein
LLPGLNCAESDHADAEDDEQCDDATTGPRVSCAAPLQGEKEAGDTREEYGRARQIEAGQLLAEGQAGYWGFGVLDGEGEQDEGDGADGKVDVETPAVIHQLFVSLLAKRDLWQRGWIYISSEGLPPRNFRREDATEQWTGDRRDAKNSTDEAQVEWSLLKRSSKHHQGH